MITPTALPFGPKKTIRAVILDGAIWFVASDLFRPFKCYTDRESLSSFRDEDLRLETLDTDTGPKRLTLVSVLGALTVATLLPIKGPRIIDSWVRREVKALAEANGLPTEIPMTLGSDGTYLVKPRMEANHYLDWWTIYNATKKVTRSPVRHGLPVLDDDDDNIIPADEQAELDARQARIQAIAAAGHVLTRTTAVAINLDVGGK
jgi:prophage antirepressor-like protein